MKIFNDRVDLPLECCEKKMGGRNGYDTFLFRHKGVLLWYTSPEHPWGESVSYAPDNYDEPLLYWSFYGGNAKCWMWLARTRWKLTVKQGKTYRFHATIEEALDRLVAEAVKLKLQGGAHE